MTNYSTSIVAKHREIPVVGGLFFFIPRNKQMGSMWYIRVVQIGISEQASSLRYDNHRCAFRKSKQYNGSGKHLEKRAIEVVSLKEIHSGFYSTPFLVP